MSNKEYLSEKVDESELQGEEIIEYPKIVEKPFVKKKKSLLKRLFSKESNLAMNPELKPNLLFLVRDDGYTDCIEGVKSGLFLINKKGSNDKRGIFLSPKKLTTLKVEPYPKVWIAYEREMTPYPLDIMHDSEEIVSMIRTYESNRSLLKDEAKIINAKMMFWLAIIGGLGVLVYIGMKNGWFNGFFG